MGMARSMDLNGASQMEEVTFYSNLFSEAVLPNYPLLNHISSQKDPWLGSSYLRLPAVVVPSFGLWEKAKSLSETFAMDYSNGTMGYAYTPLGEGYANFGVFAVITTPLLLVFAEWLLLKGWITSENPGEIIFPGLFFLSIPLTINRGEFVTVAFEIVLYSLTVCTFLRMSRIAMRRLS